MESQAVETKCALAALAAAINKFLKISSELKLIVSIINKILMTVVLIDCALEGTTVSE